MVDAVHLILGLEDWCNWKYYWPQLLQGSVLFEGLHALVGQRQVPPNLLVRAEEIQSKFPQDPKRYQVARALICCARLAEEQKAKLLDHPFNEIDGALNALKGMPPECIPPEQEEWARGCIYSFLTPLRWPRGVDVPVALYDESAGADRGFIGTLKLEVSPQAAGLSHHPGDTLTTGFGGFDDRFITSMSYAWEAAYKLAFSDRADPPVIWRGRWRLVGPGGQPQPVHGASASGAAAAGWYHALTDTLPDPDVIFLAEMGATGALSRVDGIPEKVAAIVAENTRQLSVVIKKPGSKVQLLDTLAVADKRNKEEAKRKLQEMKNDFCHVVLIEGK